jgi:hypothetical protein
MFPVRLGIVGQLCVPFVCRSSSGSSGDGDKTSPLTVGKAITRRFRAKDVCLVCAERAETSTLDCKHRHNPAHTHDVQKHQQELNTEV